MVQKESVISFFKPPALSFDEVQYIEALLEVILDSGKLTNGRFCRELEEMVKGIYSAKHAITCGSGTAGLWLVLRALGSKRVALPAFTWKSLAEITPEQKTWLDIDPNTWLPIVKGGEKVDTYIINLTFGNVDDYSEKVPEDKDLVYDAAQCFGARMRDIGTATVFSCSPTKPFSTCEGGIIVTDDSELAKKIEALRDVYSRMSEIHAVIGQVYLGRLGQVLVERREIWNYYRRHLPYKFQKIMYSTSYSVYGMLVNPPEERDKIIERLEGKVEYKIYYEPLKRGLANTEKVYSQILAIPSYPRVDKEQIVKSIIR